MTGHEPLIAMRRNGFKPAFVWLSEAGFTPSTHEVHIAKTDIPEALDLRFLVGVTVLAESQNRERLGQILKACMEAKARRVIASLYRKEPNGLFETFEITDTEGDLNCRN
jgi:hypothetical protein